MPGQCSTTNLLTVIPAKTSCNPYPGINSQHPEDAGNDGTYDCRDDNVMLAGHRLVEVRHDAWRGRASTSDRFVSRQDQRPSAARHAVTIDNLSTVLSTIARVLDIPSSEAEHPHLASDIPKRANGPRASVAHKRLRVHDDSVGPLNHLKPSNLQTQEVSPGEPETL